MAVKLYEKLKHSVRYWLLRNLPPCQQAVETVSQSMERRLKLGESVKLKLHLWICVWCQWYMEHLQILRNAARAQGGEAADQMAGATLSDEARERIRSRLNNQN